MNFRDVVKDAKKQIQSCAAFSVSGIRHICKEIGPRPCGEESEKKAQEYMAEELKKYADTVDRETFKVHPDAFMAFVPVAGASLLASTACNLAGAFKNKKFSAASLGFVGAALAGVVGEFVLYKKFLDPFFKEKESGNVIAVRKAAGETKKRIILSGHTDSAPEWTYTYALGSHGVLTVAGYALVGLAYNVATTALSLTMKDRTKLKKLALGQLAFVPAYGLLFAFTNGKRYVPGASDNLSGCYVASSVMKFLAENDIRFENTDVVALLVGGEEAGLRGSKAFFEMHPELKEDSVETMFASFDTIRDEDYMMIYNRDMTGLVKNDENACRLMQNAAAECGMDVPLGAIPLGSTDAAAASQAGVPAASFVAMDPAPARYYHTRLDTADNVVPETIEKTIGIALQTVFDFDEKGLSTD